ncbi:uncharacterized protein LOC129240574 [Anastrepha obliqua]|uniref:uncharacterized protein LOC129240574 n=1 Tax=Anastrepha obliqua TaxID=95512 RepID=UPI00240A5BAC|nr:uncharacterized protein LOC129240574 [Anastrepha obliqua]
MVIDDSAIDNFILFIILKICLYVILYYQFFVITVEYSALDNHKTGYDHHIDDYRTTKLFIATCLALLACAAADVSHLGGGYNYPAPIHIDVRSQPIVPQNSYVPPPPPAPAPSQGYSYPAPVHEAVKSQPIAPQNSYVPPPPPPPPAPAPSQGYSYPAPVHEAVKSQPIAPQNSYVPPPPAPAPSQGYSYPAPVHEAVKSQPIAPPQNTYIPPSASLHQDGYHYKTARRVVYRRRFRI